MSIVTRLSVVVEQRARGNPRAMRGVDLPHYLRRQKHVVGVAHRAYSRTKM